MSYRMDAWDFVDQQDSSPLFNGRIPAEIRTLIFEFTLAGSTVPALDRPVRHAFFARDDHEKLDDEANMETSPAGQADDQTEDEGAVQTSDSSEDRPAPAVQMPPASFLFRSRDVTSGWDWLRPGFSGHRKVHTALLRTCRRVYMETYRLPSQGSKIFYTARGPPWCSQSPNEYLSGLAPEAARHIRNLHIFLEPSFLDSELVDLVTGMQKTLRRFGRNRLPRNALPIPQPQTLNLPPFFTAHYHSLNIPPQAPAINPPPVGLLYQIPLPGNPSQMLNVYQHPPLGPGNPQGSPWEPYEPQDTDPAAVMRAWHLTEHLTSLRIYMRRTDWPSWEHNAPLVISPFVVSPYPTTPRRMRASMRDSFEADQKVEPQLRYLSPSIFREWGCWGLLFLQMPKLQTLSIDFETSEDKKSEMETIVDWAHQHWRFPVLRRLAGDSRDPFSRESLRRGRFVRPVSLASWSEDLETLTAADEPVQKTSWRGLPYHFAEQCPVCNVKWDTPNGTPDCAECNKKHRLTSLGKGPQLLVWTVNWTRKVPPKDPEAGANTGESSREPEDQLRPGRVPDPREDGAPANSEGIESHILAMLPEDAQHGTRRQRELDELMNREVVL